MRPIVALRHVPHEGMGTLKEVFQAEGLAYSYIDLFHDVPKSFHPEQVAGLVILGGPMNVDETDRFPFLEAEVGWIRDAVRLQIPTLGICLGAQLLAKALGAQVRPHDIAEIGWYDIETSEAAREDPMFRHLPPRQPVFQWHGDTYDLPFGAMQLATSPRCRQQAFRYGHMAYGLQFHLEVTERMIERWLKVPQNVEQFRNLPDVDADEIRATTPRLLAEIHDVGQKMFTTFAEMCVQHVN